MSRKSMLLALVSVLALTLVACGEAKDTGFPPPPVASPSEDHGGNGDHGDGPVEYDGPIDVAAGNVYDPKEVKVKAGTEVVWEQSDPVPHTVTSSQRVDGKFLFDSHPDCGSDCMQRGDEFRYTFDKPGTYPYFCKLHGTADGVGMAGTVIVE